jgi:hypothetical protein
LWNRPDDVLGVGIGQILPSKKYKEVNGLKAKPESHLEMYYNFKVNEHFSLSRICRSSGGRMARTRLMETVLSLLAV